MPDGIIIRTPPPTNPSPPMVNPSSASICCRHIRTNTNPIFMDELPFVQFSFALNMEARFPSAISESGSSRPFILPQGICSSIFDQFITRTSGAEPSDSFTQTVKALMPEGVFSSHPMSLPMEVSPGHPSLTVNFLTLTIFLASNKLLEPTANVSKKIYEWLKRGSNAGLMEHLLSTGGPTAQALAENLFRLAIDDDDPRTVKKMMELGVDPNQQIYRTVCGSIITPFQRACQMRSVGLVRVLIDAGADVEGTESHGWSALTCALEYFEDDDDPCPAELVRLLLGAGTKVNPRDGRSPLGIAAKSGSVETVALLIVAGAEVNLPDGRLGTTPLMKALQSEWFISDDIVIAIVMKLLDAGADPKATACYGGKFMTALEAALLRDSNELVQLLLDRGAHIQESAFLMVVTALDLDTVKLLLNSGARVTQRAIEIAAQAGDCELVLFLLESAEESIKERIISAAMIKAIHYGFTDVLDALDASDVELMVSDELPTAITAAADRGDTPILRLLLSKNSRHRAIVSQFLGDSLSCAILRGHNDITEMLLAAGADVSPRLRAERGWPLLEAIHRKDLDLTRKLLAAGAAVNAVSRSGRLGTSPLIRSIINAGAWVNAVERGRWKTALTLAVEKGDAKTTQLLIDAGADVNFPCFGPTPLEAAIKNKDNDMVEYLLGRGADPDEDSLSAAVSGSVELARLILSAFSKQDGRLPKQFGCHALGLAIRSKNAAMIEFLLANGVDPSTPVPWKHGRHIGLDAKEDSALGTAIKTDRSADLWIVQMLLRWGADPNSIVNNFLISTPLSAAIAERNLAMVNILIEAGGNVNASITAALWETPLQLAVEKGCMNIIQVLLQHGADVNASVADGLMGTPLQLAIEEGRIDIVQVLLQHGADVNVSVVVTSTHTPLQLAVERGRMDIVQVLLEHGADVNAPPYDRYGATALQFAAIGGYVGLAYLLMEKEADVNAPPARTEGRTALEGAAEHGRIDMLQLLLKAGAQVIGSGGEQFERAKNFRFQERSHCCKTNPGITLHPILGRL
ncbi:hypothetical protein EPUS_05297 [Endocarpon pusillum Z07020]|uniref:Uncharacterized protein n=1 Tax=Endocarpon pusillum (strain Z07020 / HMAS-L-300199) TaxID=1263415 RepID=U1G964_ENDPU|nr:uncharacterized protein EPUS_05297 [Endocarpon pusillum Z07020]ERF68216.1 hypothetical protein EPUS_05297 [Endocarpon pusillum Z07020]